MAHSHAKIGNPSRRNAKGVIERFKLGILLRRPASALARALHVNQHLHLVEPGVSFGNGSSDSTVYDQDPSNKNGIRFGLWAGLQYKFDVGWWIICPYVGYDIGLTKVLSTTSWSMSTILAGVDFKYGIK